MAAYEYIAIDSNGRHISGIYKDIDNITMIRAEMEKMGCRLLKTKRLRDGRIGTAKVKHSDIASFSYKFAEIYSAGMPIIKCIETIEKQTEHKTLRNILADIRQDVEAGTTLTRAFGKYKNVFSDFFLGMVEAGEQGGKLSETLSMSAIYMEKQAEIRHKIKSAFAYPVMVGLMSILIVSYMIIFVIPVFSKLYQRLHVPLPAPTRAILFLSEFMRNWWWAVLIFIALSVILTMKLWKTPLFRAKWDYFKLNMPIFKKLNRMIVVSRFMRTFSILVAAGVSLVEAIDVARIVAHNTKISDIAEEMKHSIETGNPIGSFMETQDIFPPIITQLTSLGEQTGVLSKMLNKALDTIDKEIDRTVSSIMTKLEPAMTVVMGLVIGFILIVVYMPMFDYMRHIK